MPPKAPVAKKTYSTAGLAEAWELTEALRLRAREHGQLLLHPKSQKVAALTIKNALLNQEVLKPAIIRLRMAGGKMPNIDDVISECERFFQKVGREVTSTQPSKDGWTIRRMLSWLKRKCVRKEVGKDPLT